VELKNIFIEPTEKTPQIDLNHLTGELILSGRSIPENATELYSGIHSWIKEYSKNPRLNTNLRLNLEYFNTSSSIWLAKIVKTLCSIDSRSPDKHGSIHLDWYIEIYYHFHQQPSHRLCR